MNKEFCTYEQALALKELGIDFVPIGYHRYDMKRKPVISNETAVRIHGSTDCLNHPAILYQQAFRWFREKYKLHPHICYFNDTNVWHGDIYKLENGGLMNQPMELTNYKTYEEAEQACLDKLIEIVKNK